jgi:hypothetical protein
MRKIKMRLSSLKASFIKQTLNPEKIFFANYFATMNFSLADPDAETM